MSPLEELGSPELDAPGNPPETPPRRVPNLGHALAFITIAAIFLLLLEAALTLAFGPAAEHRNGTIVLLRPKQQLAVEAATYVATLGVAWLIFPIFWGRSFLNGVRWSASSAARQAGRLIPLGILLGILSAIVDAFVSSPQAPPIDDFFASAFDAWLITAFGVLVAPLFEEICFRGFLLPAFAIAYDWLTLPRTEQASHRWRTSTALSPLAWTFSALLTSLCFAALHSQQVSGSRGALAVLFSVSLLLSLVRVKTGSVAASALVHSSYNAFIFAVTIVQTGGYRHLERMTR